MSIVEVFQDNKEGVWLPVPADKYHPWRSIERVAGRAEISCRTDKESRAANLTRLIPETNAVEADANDPTQLRQAAAIIGEVWETFGNVYTKPHLAAAERILSTLAKTLEEQNAAARADREMAEKAAREVYGGDDFWASMEWSDQIQQCRNLLIKTALAGIHAEREAKA